MGWVNKIEHVRLTNVLTIKLCEVYHHKGKQSLYNKIFKDHTNTVMKKTIEVDVLFFSKFLELNIPKERIISLVRKNVTPKNNAEKTLVGFKKVQENIMTKHSTYEFSTNEIQTIHSLVFKHIGNVKFRTEQVKTKLKSQTAVSKRLELDNVLEQAYYLYNNNKVEKLVLCLLVFIDFINIKVFKDYNYLTSIMLLQLLLLKSEFNNFIYFSIYEYIENNIEQYNKVISAATFGYEEGLSQPLPLIDFVLNMLISSGKEIDHLARNYEYELQQNKSNSIENTIYKLHDVFSKDDIRIYYPCVSDSTINRCLHRLKSEGVIRPLGKGRSAKWMRLKNIEKFSLVQTSLHLQENK